MIRIGAVNIDTSHPRSFAEYLKLGNRARYAAVYNDGFRGDDEVAGFINKYGLEKRCRTLAEIADYVDIGFIHSCNWDKHIEQALPFIEREKPVFIDKPIVGSLSDCRLLEKLSAEGAVILGSSSVRYAREIEEFLSRPADELGKIINIFGTAGVDEFNYAVHIVEGIGALAGSTPYSNRFVGQSSAEGKTCETFFVRFSDCTTAVYNTFQGVWQPFEVVIMTSKSTYRFRIDTRQIYGALLDRICDYLEKGINRLAPMTKLTESIKTMLAGRISRNRDGIEVRIADIPEEDPGYDGSIFERGYAAASGKIYL